MSLQVGDECPRCKRKVTEWSIAELRKRKIQNALNSLAKRKANGTLASGGRPKIRNDEQIKKLRLQGLSIRQIAKEIGLSTMAVQRGLK